jgi:hypothetical protein
MFRFINDRIVQFKPCFKRVTTWLAFTCIVIGFIVRTDIRGITSVIAALRMDPKRYTSLLKFFRSNAFQTHDLYTKLIQIIQKIIPLKTVNGHIVLVGDHTKIAKEGFRMASCQKRHQDSQNSGKPEYIDGHNFGFISALTGGTVRSIPVRAELQESAVKTGGESIIVQMVNCAGKVAETFGKPAIILLDAYFYKPYRPGDRSPIHRFSGESNAQDYHPGEAVRGGLHAAAGTYREERGAAPLWKQSSPDGSISKLRCGVYHNGLTALRP